MTADHYFSADPGSDFTPRRIQVTLAGRDVRLTTAPGVFSPEHLDGGTRVLLANVPQPPPGGDLLDIGSSSGPRLRRGPEICSKGLSSRRPVHCTGGIFNGQ